MTDVTHILSQIESGEPAASDQLLPLVYNELRKLAAVKLAQEKPGQTMQPTSLVHEAYLRLVAGGESRSWDNRGHFFAAASEAMRRILIDAARRRSAAKRGAGRRQPLTLEKIAEPESSADLLLLDDALEKLARANPRVAELVKLRCFAGLTNREAAQCLGISPRTADGHWAYAKAWLLREIQA